MWTLPPIANILSLTLATFLQANQIKTDNVNVSLLYQHYHIPFKCFRIPELGSPHHSTKLPPIPYASTVDTHAHTMVSTTMSCTNAVHQRPSLSLSRSVLLLQANTPENNLIPHLTRLPIEIRRGQDENGRHVIIPSSILLPGNPKKPAAFLLRFYR